MENRTRSQAGQGEEWQRSHAAGPYLEMAMRAMSCGYFVPEVAAAPVSTQAWSGPLESMLRVRREALEGTIDGILAMIVAREKMRDEHVARIDYESCEARTRVFEFDQWHPGMNREVGRVRMSQERELGALQRERRMAEVECWRDVSRLRLELQHVTEEWSRERRRESFVLGGR